MSEDIKDEIIIESIKSIFRNFRKLWFDRMDIYEKNIVRGRIQETPSQRSDLDIWYEEMLNFPNTISSIDVTIEDYPRIPNCLHDQFEKPRD